MIMTPTDRACVLSAHQAYQPRGSRVTLTTILRGWPQRCPYLIDDEAGSQGRRWLGQNPTSAEQGAQDLSRSAARGARA